MDKSEQEEVLAKVAPDRRRFVQSILGLTGYAVPAVRSFVMASAAVPAFAVTVTTTTRNAWRPTAQGRTEALLRQQTGNFGSLIPQGEQQTGSGSLLNQRTRRTPPGRKP